MDMLRKSQLAKSRKGQFRSSYVPLSNEELAAAQAAHKSSAASLSSSTRDHNYTLDPIFLQQRQAAMDERRRKSEAAANLRGYRGAYVERRPPWRHTPVYVHHRHQYDGSESVCSGLTGFSGYSEFGDDQASRVSWDSRNTHHNKPCIDAIELVMNPQHDEASVLPEDHDEWCSTRSSNWWPRPSRPRPSWVSSC